MANNEDANVFETIDAFARLKGFGGKATKKAIDWYKQQISTLGNISRMKLLGDNLKYQVSKPQIGQMLLYFYSPKHKETLPYYDTFPLTIIIEEYTGKGAGFLGINLHYLPPVLRAKLLGELVAIQGSNFTEAYKLNLSYGVLKSASNYYKPCVKRYLWNHVKSNFVAVPPGSYLSATFLPVASFKKASATEVWADSRKKI